MAALVSPFLATTSTATAADKPKAIISLGDSFISGEAGRWAGNGNASTAGDVFGTDRAAYHCTSPDSCQHDPAIVYAFTAYNGCHRSDVAEIRGAEIDGVPLEGRLNIACSGAITDNVVDEDFKGEQPQITQLKQLATDNQITTVVLSISGNDLKFNDIIAACANAYFNAFASPCSKTQPDGLKKRLPDVKEKVIGAVNKIQSTMREAGYEQGTYRLILQSYPTPIPHSGDYRRGESSDFPYGRYRLDGCPFLDVDTDWANDSLIPSIDDMLRDAALTTGASFLDLTDAFVGHELCNKQAGQATKDNNQDNPLPAERAEWVRWLPYVVKGDFPWEGQGDQQEGIHPNAYGQVALSTCLTKMVAVSPGPGEALRCTGEAGQGPESVKVSRDSTTETSESGGDTGTGQSGGDTGTGESGGDTGTGQSGGVGPR
jgi:hypothetical protein